MTTDELDLDALAAVADAATPGRWIPDAAGYVETLDGQIIASDTNEGNTVFISTFDPPTVIALLERLEAAETRNRDAVVIVEGYAERLESKQVRLSEAWAERDALRSRLAETESEGLQEALRMEAQAATDAEADLTNMRDLIRALADEYEDDWPCSTNDEADNYLGCPSCNAASRLRALLDEKGAE